MVTGKVEPYTRDEMNSLIASLGAVAGSSVTRKTDYLVCGEKAGSKLSKARELDIPVLTPEEFSAWPVWLNTPGHQSLTMGEGCLRPSPCIFMEDMQMENTILSPLSIAFTPTAMTGNTAAPAL